MTSYPTRQPRPHCNEAGAATSNVRYFPADASNPDAVEDLLNRVTESTGVPDVVCCHAGMVDAFPIETYPIDKWDSLIGLNLRSAFLVAQTISRRWIDNGTRGHLIFTTRGCKTFLGPR